MVQDRQVQSTRQPSQNVRDILHDRHDALHVAADHHMRHAGCRRQLANVVVGRLLGVTQRQRVVNKVVRRLFCHLHQTGDGNRQQGGAHGVLRQQVATNQPRIGLADFGKRFASRVMNDRRHVDAAVADTAANQGDVDHAQL